MLGPILASVSTNPRCPKTFFHPQACWDEKSVAGVFLDSRGIDGKLVHPLIDYSSLNGSQARSQGQLVYTESSQTKNHKINTFLTVKPDKIIAMIAQVTNEIQLFAVKTHCMFTCSWCTSQFEEFLKPGGEGGNFMLGRKMTDKHPFAVTRLHAIQNTEILFFFTL